ncbi:MAG: family N-acetyltransferase [Ferruginibacter sp.]|nr:family N-acetyltransferase [Ferruginibacter sp.]
MNHVLHNPVFNALSSKDATFSNGRDKVKFFDEKVSPFAGFADDYPDGFEELKWLLPGGRKILYASSAEISIPAGWTLLAHIPGLQFVLDELIKGEKIAVEPVALGKEHVDEMIALTALTKPGPFDKRTIEFGSYYGIFNRGKLVAMTGQRLHLDDYSEISAVCTHPDHSGKGYAAALLQQQAGIIIRDGKTAFLHVRADNQRAIQLYERTGFKISRPMNFYFLLNQ